MRPPFAHWMVSENCLLAICGVTAPSTTVAVNIDVPALLGVPLSTPLLERARPRGSDPELTLQAYGGVPPVASRVNS